MGGRRRGGPLQLAPAPLLSIAGADSMGASAASTSGTNEIQLTKGELSKLAREYKKFGPLGSIGVARAMLAAKDDLIFRLGVQPDRRKREIVERKLARSLARAAASSVPTRTVRSRKLWLKPPAGVTAAHMRERLAAADLPSTDTTGWLCAQRLWLRVLLVRVYKDSLLSKTGAVYIDFTDVLGTALLGLHGEVLTSITKEEWHPILFAELLHLLSASLRRFPRLQLLGIYGVCASAVKNGGDETAVYGTHVLSALNQVLNLRNPPGRSARKIVGINMGELELDASSCSKVAELLAEYNVPRYFLDSRYIGGDLSRCGPIRTVQRAGRTGWWDDVTAWPDACSLTESKCGLGRPRPPNRLPRIV